MNQQQANKVFAPVGEALVRAERCRAEGRLMEAEAICRQILETQPNSPEAEHLLGVLAHQNGKLGEAIEHVQRAVKLAPQVALFHANLGEMLRLAGRPRLAVESARRAIAVDPAMAAAWSNLGVALYELKDYEEAARAQRKAIAANPNFAEGHSNLGNALHALRRFDEAIVAYRRAIELRPNFADAWANYGTTLHHSGDFPEGVVALRRAIALAPQHANARSGLGILLLMRGDLGEGWEQYEWRLRSTERKGPRFPENPWRGESLTGKHIYVQAEQGFGDSLQFARYLPLLAARAGQVTVRVHQQIVTLLRESLPGVTVLGDRGDPAHYHCDAALLSLPYLFGTRLETIPAEIGYLRAPAAQAASWKERLAKQKGLKIGVVWAGNPEHTNDSRRSLDINLFKPLFAVAGTSFVSLQVGSRTSDLEKLRRGKSKIAIEDLSPSFNDFADSAGAVSALDLVITVDTSVAHLAGSLGKPVWLLLPWVTDWRWGLNREDCLWYPTMRMYRQKKGEEWPPIIARIASDLKAVIAGDTAPLMPYKAEGEKAAADATAIIAAQAATAHLVPVSAGNAPDPAAEIAPKVAPAQALILAEQKRRAGFLGDADDLTRKAAAANPDNAEAAHMLGIIAHQSGKLSEAIDHVRRATTLNPNVALYHANLGEMCRLAGRVEEALASGRRAIELDPNNAGASNNVGIAYFDQGKFDDAVSYYDRALALQPNFAQAHSNRGNALQRLKRFGDAEQSYRNAIEQQPSFADAWNNLGTCLRELKRPEEAETVYRKALQLEPNNPDTLDNLALALKDLDRLDEAAEMSRRALVIENRRDKFHLHYGSILLEQHKINEASAAVQSALALDPNNHDSINLAGRIAADRGEHESALEHFRRALAIKPDLADVLNNMGNVLKELGRLDEAREAFLESLKLDPSNTGVYINLADSLSFKPDDPHIAAMEALSEKTEGLSKNDRIHLDFALGKVYADLKEYPRSFKHYLAGNAGKRASIAYDEKSTLTLFDRIQATFTRELMTAKTGGGDPSPMPIFVVGMPRSGTTLIEQIIASHPMVHGAGELQTFNDAILAVQATVGPSAAFPEFVTALDGAGLQRLGAQYLTEVRALAAKHGVADPERVTDKMPSNYYFVGLIRLALPNARIIHSMRDPVDTCISCFSKLFSAQQNHTYDLGELGRYYEQYERLMAHWRKVLPAESFLDVQYEQVVADTETQARRIIEYCGLPWDKRCLEFHKTDRPVRTASATQVRKPIYKNAVGRWRVYEKDLGPLLTGLGHDAAVKEAAPVG